MCSPHAADLRGLVQELKEGRIAVDSFVRGLVRDDISLVVFIESMLRLKEADEGLDANDLVRALFVRA